MTKEIEDKKATKKTPVKKVAPKKTEEVEVVVVEEEKVEKKPVRAKRVEIDMNELIPCRSTTHGNLIYISKRTGERFFWNDYGDVQDIPFGELRNLNSTYPAFIKDVLFVIDDEEAVEALGMAKLYEGIFDIEDIETLFDKEYRDLEETLEKLPKGLKDSAATKARELMKSGKLDSRSKIKLIEEKLKIELLLLED